MSQGQKKINYETTDFENSFQLIHKITTRRFQYGSHIHTCFYEINIFIRGNLEFVVEDVRRKLKHGDIAIIAPGEIHRPDIKDNSEYERLVFHISENLLAELSTPKTHFQNKFKRNKVHFTYFTEEELEKFLNYAKQINECADNPNMFGADVLLQSYLNISLALIVNKMQEHREDSGDYIEFYPLIAETIECIKEHLTDDITVQFIADYLNVSRTYLSHIFKEHTGYSVWNYVVYKRLILSQKLIMEGSTITEACYSAGFHDYAHFIKTFSKTFGVSPGRYRKQAISRITVNIPF